MEIKLRKIRLAEGFTQKALAELTGISLGTIKNYESGQNTVGLHVLQTILVQKPFRKYTLWIIHDCIPDDEQVMQVADLEHRGAG